MSGQEGTSDVVPSAELPVGGAVISRDGQHLGTVKQVVERAFKVDVSMRPDYWLATDCIASVDGDRYVLTVDAADVDRHHVSSPEQHERERDGTDGLGMTGRAGVYPHATAAAGLLVPDEPVGGSDSGLER